MSTVDAVTDAESTDLQVDSPDSKSERETTGSVDTTQGDPHKAFSWSTLIVFVVVPLIVLGLAAGAGYLKYRNVVAQGVDTARAQSVQAATEASIAMLSYSPDNVEATLHGAEDLLTGSFRDSYRSLIDDVVIPGAQQKKISATASVPAAASITATDTHATVMVFVNQSIIVGADAPTDTASAVEVTLDKIGQRWLVSGFEPK
ncbi:hypothetical protein [Mycolicibacterium austroafricanum]|uniref:hypothetical protein n=1 Tax=Mycolicibacterium austroafricanum TaxID=39687 RepID=UPI000568AAF3|nr:hypothetical protein [Mycolicibacterium austroafricanum]